MVHVPCIYGNVVKDKISVRKGNKGGQQEEQKTYRVITRVHDVWFLSPFIHLIYLWCYMGNPRTKKKKREGAKMRNRPSRHALCTRSVYSTWEGRLLNQSLSCPNRSKDASAFKSSLIGSCDVRKNQRVVPVKLNWGNPRLFLLFIILLLVNMYLYILFLVSIIKWIFFPRKMLVVNNRVNDKIFVMSIFFFFRIRT